jgi:hypothetical protein
LILSLKQSIYALIPYYFVDDGSRHQASHGERRAVPMHSLKQGASLIIDECNMLKIHRNLAFRVVGAGGAPAIFEFLDVPVGQSAADFQGDSISNRIDLRPHHDATIQCNLMADYYFQRFKCRSADFSAPIFQ